ncbi:hypothetical protein [Pararhizobium gei]|uniref:hypothetical protein n=1 Tax=Pararhizobium gei TaxID=1395951 RepID=UPI0023D99D3E|nr:hypothetical protein [Rhizobium gei]
MKILYCHRLADAKPRDAIAFVDVQMTDDLRLYGLRLIRHPDGRHMIYAPQCGQRQAASFGKPLAEQLTALALEAYEAAV